jgi:hypothetical protein
LKKSAGLSTAPALAQVSGGRNFERRRDQPFEQGPASKIRTRIPFREPPGFLRLPDNLGKEGLVMNIFRKAHAFRLHPFNVTRAPLALLLLALVAPAGAGPGNDGRAPDLGDCQELQVPAGSKVVFHAFAVGVQIYRWDGTSWNFVAPEAVLFADAGDHGEVGIHYAGPTWESVSGSKVVGMVLERCTPDPDAIPWLLLGAVSNEGPGIFARVTFIQRVNTVGGKAPTEPGDFQGEEASVPYTAEYFFYR